MGFVDAQALWCSLRFWKMKMCTCPWNLCSFFFGEKISWSIFWNAFFWFEAKGGLGHMFVENSSTWTIYSIESFGKFVYDDDHAWCEIPTRVVSKHQESHRFLEGILSAKSLSTIHGWGCIAIRVYSFFSFKQFIGGRFTHFPRMDRFSGTWPRCIASSSWISFTCPLPW